VVIVHSRSFPVRQIARAAVCLFFLILLSGCVSGPAKALRDSPAVQTELLDRLEEGDIVLTFSGGLPGWLFSTGGGRSFPEVPYSHAEVTFKEGSEWMIGGVSSGGVHPRSLKKTLGSFADLSVYRLQAPASDRKKIADVAGRWCYDPAIVRAGFDYEMHDIPGRRDKFYCAGFVNEMVREAGQPAPFFAEADPREAGAAGKHFSKVFRRNVATIVLPQSIEQNTNYVKILTWYNPFACEDRKWLDAGIARNFFSFYDEGWRLKPRPVSWPASWILKRAFKTPDAMTALTYSKPAENFSADVKSMWSRLQRRGRVEGLTPAEKDALLTKVCLRYRETYFEKCDQMPGN